MTQKTVIKGFYKCHKSSWQSASSSAKCDRLLLQSTSGIMKCDS